MAAATHLAHIAGLLDARTRDEILRVNNVYGPIPPLDGLSVEALMRRLISDKKTVQGKIHFVLPDRIGHVVVRSGIPEEQVLEATRAALKA
jgi:3-dehydroquinate synthase